mgnify:CR=1 FL=1
MRGPHDNVHLHTEPGAMSELKLPAIDPATIAEISQSGYPEPYRSRVAGRHRRRLGDAAALTNFGVNLVRLDPGSESSMRRSMAWTATPSATSTCTRSRYRSARLSPPCRRRWRRS